MRSTWPKIRHIREATTHRPGATEPGTPAGRAEGGDDAAQLTWVAAPTGWAAPGWSRPGRAERRRGEPAPIVVELVHPVLRFPPPPTDAVRPAPSERSAPAERPGPPTRPAEADHRPILPFLGVLLRGRDAPLWARARDVPPYHPSVGYARDIYVAVAMNALVDLVGFGSLFHAFVAGRWPGPGGWALGIALGAVFATAFATFAVSLIRKPLRAPQFDRRGLTIAGACVAVGVAAALLGAARPAALAVALGGGVAAVTTFGAQDGALVFTRALVMLGVGWLVAEPLHETMFHDEIDRVYREGGLAEVEHAVTGREAALGGVRDERFGACMLSHQQPADAGCAAPRAEADRADLWVQALAFVRGQELTGADAETNRTFLLERAEALDASAVVAILGAGATGRAGVGPRYAEAVALAPEAARTARTARERAEACVAAAAACLTEAEADPRVASIRAELGALHERARRLREGDAEPGPIERALALDALTAARPGPAAREPSQEQPSFAASAAGFAAEPSRAATVRGKLFAAWFLAMVMPLLVLVMKITAADKLEPYLRRRWAGR